MALIQIVVIEETHAGVFDSSIGTGIKAAVHGRELRPDFSC
jgi:hypothetical protein